MILEHNDILKILPQRSPILLVDRASECTPGQYVRAEVWLAPDWDVFRGHFPGDPVLPGIYLQESMAQTADLLLLTIPENEHKIPYLFSISRMRFLRPVTPGNTVTLFAELFSSPGDGLFECSVSAGVGDRRVASGRLTIALR